MTPLVLNNLGLGEVDKTVLNRIDKTVCTLADNMPHLNKGKVVTKPPFAFSRIHGRQKRRHASISTSMWCSNAYLTNRT